MDIFLLLLYSDSSDGSEGDGVSEEESCISGGFINDGAYTQHESPGGVETQYGMYLAVNNYHMHMQSPEDLVRGRPNVAALVRRRARLSTSSPGSVGVADTPDSSVLSSDASMLQDTPERERERHTETTARSITAAVNRGISSKHGTGKSTKDGTIDSQGEEGEAEFDCDLSAKPHRAQQSLPNRSTSAVGTGKENVGAKKSAPFWQKFRSNGIDKPASSKFVINSSSSEDSDNSSNDDDGSSSNRRKKQKLSTEQKRVNSNTAAATTTSNVLGGKGLAGGVLHSRPPLAPAQHINCSPCPQQQQAGASKVRALTTTLKSAAAAVEEEEESSLFDWGF